jgi:hypothetical protein
MSKTNETTRQEKGLRLVENDNGDIVVYLDGEALFSMPPAIACRFAGHMLNIADRRTRKELAGVVRALPDTERNHALTKAIEAKAATVSQAMRARLWANDEVYRSRDHRIVSRQD